MKSGTAELNNLSYKLPSEPPRTSIKKNDLILSDRTIINKIIKDTITIINVIKL